MAQYHKIINDPVYGFITVDHPLIWAVIEHPSYQRLRRIYQLALAYLVYPGAVHSRLHHSLGAYHLMCIAINQLRTKGVIITEEEALAAKIAILLHDVGHGPFSHTLEGLIVENVHHETLSLAIMQKINDEKNGALDTAIAIFTNKYPKHFLHQLISGQLDVDRMDYLNRDSFFSGVTEGAIGYDRILKMLNVVNDNLVVEEKGIFSVENFLISRRLMYEQVYLHKTVLATEQLVVQIIKRVQFLIAKNKLTGDGIFMQFLTGKINTQTPNWLDAYLQLDDIDVLAQIKSWQFNDDVILSTLCKSLINRKLPKCKFANVPFTETEYNNILSTVMEANKVSKEDAGWYIFGGKIAHSIYNISKETITILKKDSTLVAISSFENTLLTIDSMKTIEKYYLCYPKVSI